MARVSENTCFSTLVWTEFRCLQNSPEFRTENHVGMMDYAETCTQGFIGIAGGSISSLCVKSERFVSSGQAPALAQRPVIIPPVGDPPFRTRSGSAFLGIDLVRHGGDLDDNDGLIPYRPPGIYATRCSGWVSG